MQCVQCQVSLTPGAKFCPECGTPQPRSCPACHAPAPPKARFCQECGTSLAPAAPWAAGGPGSPASQTQADTLSGRALTSPTASSQAGTGHNPSGQTSGSLVPAASRPASAGRDAASSQGERRQMSVIFCDLVESVSISRKLDPEDLRDMIRDYRQVCSDIVRRHDGTPAQFQGDGIVVYFGYPVAHEDAPRRAVQAALDIVQGVSAMSPEVQRRYGVRLAVRAAVHTGLAVIGEFGADATADAMGSTTNIAARIQSVVGPDTVAISSATQRLVAGYFDVESLGSHQVKGVAEAQEVFVVHAATQARDRVQASSALLSPYIGHGQTIDTLQDLWRSAADGHGRAVFLTGEPGVGKSRMLSEFRRLIRGTGDLIECWCSPYYSQTALYPVVRGLRAYHMGAEALPAAEQHTRLRAVLQELGCHDEAALPIVAEFFGLPMPPGYEPLRLHPLTHRQKTIATFGTMLRARAVQSPTLLLLEDLHWSDATTVELIGSVLAQLTGLRMLIVMTSRAGFAAPWLSNEAVMSVHVSQLSPSDTAALISELAGGQPLPPALMSVLVEKTEGNPLYIEEMTRMFLESGYLQEGGAGHGLVHGRLPDSLVPSSLHDLLMARLDRLTPSARRVVQLGSVIGRHWTIDMLMELLPGEEDTLVRGIEELVASGFVYATEQGFRIKHALIQDAAYDSLLKRVRQQYHRRVAEAMSRSEAEAGAGHAERLAQHWARAGEHDKAAPLWLDAGRRAVAASATVEAESHLRQGLESLSELPPSADRDLLELATLATLGVALTIRNGWAAPDVAQAYQRAQEVSERLGPTPQLFWVLWGMWAFYLVKGDQHEGMSFARRLMTLAEEQRDSSMKLESDFALGLSHYYQGHLDLAQTHLDAALDVYVPELHHANAHLTAQDVGVTSRSVSAMVLYLRGHTQASLAMSAEVLELAERLRHPFSRAYALGCAAWLDHMRGDREGMAWHADATIAHSNQQALGFWVVWGMLFAGRAAADQGVALKEAAGQIEQALTTIRAIGSGMVVPYFLAMLAEVEAEAGDPMKALERLADARTLIAQGGEEMAAAEVDRIEARIHAQWAESGSPVDPAAVEVPLQRALETALQQGNRVFALRAACDWAVWRSRRGDGAQALDVLRQAIQDMPDHTPTPDLVRAQAHLETLSATLAP